MNIALNQTTAEPVVPKKPELAPGRAFSMREQDGYFRHTTRTEAVLRFVGIVIILSAFIQFLIPDTSFGGNPHFTKLGLSVACTMIGIALYTHATRGHRSEVSFDPARKDLCIAHLDRRDSVRSTRRIPLRNIKSIYVLKSETPGVPAKMRVRLYDSPNEITVVRGRYDEIEMAHRQLCRNIRLTQA